MITNDMTDYGCMVKLLPMNDQIRELQTILRDRNTSQSDFTFYADRLIRLVTEEGLNQLPYSENRVHCPTGQSYDGVKFAKGICGVSIVRSGEAMEKGLRECCRSIRIGKILIQKDFDNTSTKVVYAKLLPDIEQRKVLVMYPIMNSGNTVVRAIEVLMENRVDIRNIIILNLFSTPSSLQYLISKFPDVTLVTTEIHPVTPTHFGQKYFGTD